MRRFLIAVLMSFALLCSVHALAATQQLLVTDRAINAIYRYDASTGAYLGAFQQVSQLSQPMGMATGSDGLLYVASSGNNQILRYNLATGSFVDVFATSQSRLNAPDSLAFGPDGKLYVSNSGSIVRFNTQTGGYETFVQDAGPFPATGLRYPSGITFGLSGDLYACAQCSTYPVYRYNVVNAQQVESYPADDKLLSPGRLAFAPDGTLYIATKGSGAIYKYDVASRQ
jgi:sugar lactone lactonase YvrE